jgi:hypothetical protein
VLPSNSTLWRLDLGWQENNDPDLLAVFSALGKNTGLKALKVSVYDSMDESLSTAMKDGLGMNKTLESLEFDFLSLCDDNADLWCGTFSFLRTNKALKSLVVNVKNDATDSCVATLRSDIACMLQENASLESLCIRSFHTSKIEAEVYFVLVTALQHNTMLKSLSLVGCYSLTLTHDEDKQLASLLKKNYALESLRQMKPEGMLGNVGAILQLNAAGRRYLVQDGSSMSKGVKVLSAVCSDINCIFLHLLENPRLCDRSAVEIVSGGESDGSRSTSPPASSVAGKREQAGAHSRKESRRRLA